MILRSLVLEQFGKFRGRTFEFRRGMNLVVGPNEAGKSTLAEAIPAVLFGSAQVEHLKPWGRNACVAALVFEGEGRTVEVRRNLLTDEVHLAERDDLYHTLAEFTGKVPFAGRSASCQEYRRLLGELLGVTEEDLFRATYFFGQHHQRWTGSELAQKLRTLVGGSVDADFSAILDSLLDEHFTLTCENPWGRNKQRERELEGLNLRLAELADLPAPATPPPVETSAQETPRLQALTAQLEHDRAEYQKGVRYVEKLRLALQEKAKAAPVVAAEPVPPATSVAVDGGLAEQLAAAGLPASPPANLFELLAEAAAIRQELAQLHPPLVKLQQREKALAPVPWLGLGLASGLLAIGAGLSWWQAVQPIPVSLAAGVMIGGLSGWGIRRHRQHQSCRAEIQTEQRRLEQQRAAVQARQADLSEQCEALGLPTSAVDMVRLQKAAEKHRELLAACWQGVSSSVSRPAPTAAPGPTAAPPAGTAAGSAERAELVEMEQRLAEFAAQLAAREQELADLRRSVKPEPPPHPAADSSVSRQELLQRKAQVEERIEVLRTAVDLLSAAVEQYGTTHLVKLAEEASRLFGKMTAGRYRHLRFDGEMRPEVRIDERRWVAADRFSRGTVDALYLALRMALAKVRSDGRSLPMLLDDPFVHLDQKRTAAALNMLDLVAADGQLVILSHNETLAKRAARERWHVVSLGEDQAEAQLGEGEEHAGQLHLL